MPDRTHPPIQDEALRQARTDAPIRDSLRYIATRLADRRPQVLMTDAARLAIALSAAYVVHPRNDDAAEQLERDLLQRMPYVDRPITRGEYALLLNKASWSAS
ncbi:hypothetical protein [Streptomyces purpureus]|uniref:Uncharacterized protein n=1 Tax=Streptomyces purpureus TaxID=1951 RepID=A0A918H6X8_9ACTN|nr:hypothetical protein [Streptomyces purpureus]GGT43467.1 hypothetical protein GCM10014713_41470 [Streptomyces purpureus]